jgi:nucleoside-diphosphate-sugar epimerase
LGPIVHYLNSLSSINTSNERIRNIMTGAAKEKCPPTGVYLWVDVRDIADAHVLTAEKEEAAGKRFFIVAGRFSNKDIVEIIHDAFPQLRDNLPTGEALESGDYPKEGVANFDNSRSVEVLGLKYRLLKESIVDAVKSLQAVEGK